MKIKNAFILLFVLVSTTAFGQNKEIRIGPGPVPKKPEPVVIFDGIKVPRSLTTDLFAGRNKESIEAVSLLPDSIFDSNGRLTNIGIVRIYSKDSIHPGAKKILEFTDDWLYSHPLTRLMINNTLVNWDEETYFKLTSLEADDIINAEVMEGKTNEHGATIKLRIRE